MKQLSIVPKPLLVFTLAFIMFTVIGTVSHELGHISMAKLLGYKTVLSYGSSGTYPSDLSIKLRKIYDENKVEITNGIDFPEKLEYEKGIKKLNNEHLLIAIGGPLQTTITGIIGLLMLYWRRTERTQFGFKFMDWLAVFLSLFWLREVFNLLMSVTSEIIQPNGSYFSGDEANISYMSDIPVGTLPILMGILGLVISTLIVFRIVPFKLRLTFIISGLIGGINGFYLWMNVIGPKILP